MEDEPKLSRPRMRKFVGSFLDDETRAALGRAALEDDLPVSAWIRRTIRQALAARRPSTDCGCVSGCKAPNCKNL